MLRKCVRALSYLGFVALLCTPSTTWAQVAPNLGQAQVFGALGNSAVTGSTGSGTVVNGDVGSYPTPTIDNFPPSSVGAGFTIHRSADAIVQQAHIDARAAYDFLAGQGTGTPLGAQLNGQVLTSGVYSFTSTADLAASGTLTLNGPGIFVFNVQSSLTMNVLSTVVGTANPCNIYWRVGVSATLNGANFWGTVIADASITVGGGTVSGRVLAGTGATGAVTMPGSGGNTIGGCTACSTITVAPSTLPNGTVGVAYSQQLTASGGTGSYTFSVTSGTPPAGLTLTAGGLLSGTPTTAASYTFTVQATDGGGCPGVRSYTIVISTAVPTLPQAFVVLLALGLTGVGYFRLRRRARAD